MKKCFHESEGERMIDDEVMARYRERMTALAESFPMLGQADGVHPWDADRLESWLLSGAPGSGARSAGRFLLSVWNPYHPWRSGAFDLHEALGCWDNHHRAAFTAWVRAPWWP
jgi:hypothetical protein